MSSSAQGNSIAVHEVDLRNSQQTTLRQSNQIISKEPEKVEPNLEKVKRNKSALSLTSHPETTPAELTNLTKSFEDTDIPIRTAKNMNPEKKKRPHSWFFRKRKDDDNSPPAASKEKNDQKEN